MGLFLFGTVYSEVTLMRRIKKILYFLVYNYKLDTINLCSIVQLVFFVLDKVQDTDTLHQRDYKSVFFNSCRAVVVQKIVYSEV